MTEISKTFGTPEKFSVRIAWTEDAAPVEQRPIPHGWSMGQIEIIVGGLSLTEHEVAGKKRGDVEWYLGPLLHWLADNWVPLLHEELLPWERPPEGPASVSVERSLNHWSKSDDSQAVMNYQTVQAWYLRHCISAASLGGLFPSIYIRRFLDDIEVSWTGHAPDFAPDNFKFKAAAGVARLDAADVVEPLWHLLQWVCQFPPDIPDTRFTSDWLGLCEKVDALKHVGGEALAVDIATELLARVQASFREIQKSELVEIGPSTQAPYLVRKPLAVAMFGGLEPNLQEDDIRALRDALIGRSGVSDSALLSELISADIYKSMGLKPHDDGYDFADYFYDDLLNNDLDPTVSGFVDIRWVCESLGIKVSQLSLNSSDIRGVALAGAGFGPSIIVNTNHHFNKFESGRRFTIAHELCHIIADRNRAKEIGHSSGAWALPSIEKRANAFAAYFLMPRSLLLAHVQRYATLNDEAIQSISEEMKIGMVALIHHLFNLNRIDETERDALLYETRRLN